MPTTIRPAKLEDVPAIVAIEQASPSAAHWTPEQYNKVIVEGVVLVAEETGNPRGFICAKAVAAEWEIENVVVDSRFLRHGFADELLRKLVQRAQDKAASAILLEVRQSNVPARRLYEKHGFRESGRRPRYYPDPMEDAILYKLQFDR
jgi:ribosomal-protein-alanine acetyltransferase